MLFGHHDLLRTIPDFKCIVIVSRQFNMVCLFNFLGRDGKSTLVAVCLI